METVQGRSYGADQHVLRCVTRDDEAIDKNVIPGQGNSTRGKVSQVGPVVGRKAVDFSQRDTSRIVLAADDGRIRSRRKVREDGWFAVILRRKAGCLDLCSLWTRDPVVV